LATRPAFSFLKSRRTQDLRCEQPHPGAQRHNAKAVVFDLVKPTFATRRLLPLGGERQGSAGRLIAAPVAENRVNRIQSAGGLSVRLDTMLVMWADLPAHSTRQSPLSQGNGQAIKMGLRAIIELCRQMGLLVCVAIDSSKFKAVSTRERTSRVTKLSGAARNWRRAWRAILRSLTRLTGRSHPMSWRQSQAASRNTDSRTTLEESGTLPRRLSEMKRFMALVLGVALVGAPAATTFAQTGGGAGAGAGRGNRHEAHYHYN
jgi:hypothetical protein